MKVRELSVKSEHESLIIKSIKDFFNPNASWGRQNRNQLIVGVLSLIAYYITNSVFKAYHPAWNPFRYSSSGLVIAVYLCIGLISIRFVMHMFHLIHNEHPWYEGYMPMIISLLGLVTLIAIQNISTIGVYDVSLWINIIVLFVIFIIAAGYFVEGNSNEKVIKIWFSLLGYYFSVIAFFYFLDRFITTI
jgi:hypothetical protein